MSINLRKAKFSDLDQVYEIEEASFKDVWSEDDFLEELYLPDYLGRFYVAEENGEIKGYIIFRIYDEGIHIINIAVREDARRKGIGTMLLNKAEEVAISKNVPLITLEVRVSNYPAIKLYKKLNYKILDTISDFYSDGEDAYLMIKRIK